MMIFSEQIRAARALLGWKQAQLADLSGVGVATIRRLESQSGPVQGNVSTVLKIQGALESAGIQFISQTEANGPGVQLSAPIDGRT